MTYLAICSLIASSQLAMLLIGFVHLDSVVVDHHYDQKVIVRPYGYLADWMLLYTTPANAPAPIPTYCHPFFSFKMLPLLADYAQSLG